MELKDSQYTVNKKLYDYALAEMPQNATKLEQAWHIYERLCKRLEYSLEYFIEEQLHPYEQSPKTDKYLSLDYVSTVDGEKNNEVVCFIFTAIFSYILYDQKLISEDDFLLNSHIYGGKFQNKHALLKCTIDDVPLLIDSSYGMDMDLCRTKYGSGKLNGWRFDFTTDCDIDDAITKLRKIFDKQDERISKLKEKENLYKNLKISEKIFEKLSFDERVSLFFDSIAQAPAYSFSALSYANSTYHNIFSIEESHGSPQYVDSTFIYEDNEVKEYFFVNRKGYIESIGEENFKYLEIYSISLKTKQIEKINREKLIGKTDSKKSIVLSDNEKKKNGSRMMNVGSTLRRR